jgi:hypothetical protein
MDKMAFGEKRRLSILFFYPTRVEGYHESENAGPVHGFFNL